MKQKKIIGVAVAGVLVIAALWLFRSRLFPPAPPTLVTEEKRRHGPCPGETETLAMKDSHMPRSFPVGTQFRLIRNWYACHPVERGNFVYHQYSFSRDPVVRTVVAIPGDKFELVKDKAHKSWNLRVNNELLMDDDDHVHYFGPDVPPLLSLYERSMKKVLPKKNYIIFSEDSPGDFDSGTLGVVNEDDFLGKVEPIKTERPGSP